MGVPENFDDLAAMKFEQIENSGRTMLGWFLYLIIQAIAELRAAK